MAALLLVLLPLAACSADAERQATPPKLPPSARPTGPVLDYSLSIDVKRAARSAGVPLGPVVRAAMARAAASLPGEFGSVYLEADDGRAYPGFGVGGRTTTTGSVSYLYIDLDAPDLRKTLQKRVPQILAHELDHSVRFLEGPGVTGGLLDAMVFEGVADSFAREIYPEAEAFPWDDALTKGEEAATWSSMRAVLRKHLSRDRLFRWIFGGGGVPTSAGYSIGWHIVQGYLDAHPDVTAADLTLVDAEEIFEGSNYSP